MTQILMPMATAVWLVENTSLTFEQIATFCGLHEMEVQSIADGEIGGRIIGQNPVLAGQVSEEDIKNCEKDQKKNLTLIEDKTQTSTKKRKHKYIPIVKRRDKPDAIFWLIKNYPEIPDIKIVKLIGTTKKTIESIKDRTHSDMQNIQPKDPVFLGLCSQSELEELIEKYKPQEEGQEA